MNQTFQIANISRKNKPIKRYNPGMVYIERSDDLMKAVSVQRRNEKSQKQYSQFVRSAQTTRFCVSVREPIYFRNFLFR